MTKKPLPHDVQFEILNVLAAQEGNAPVSSASLMHQVQNRIGLDFRRDLKLDFQELMKEMEKQGHVASERSPAPSSWWKAPFRSLFNPIRGFSITNAGRYMREPIGF